MAFRRGGRRRFGGGRRRFGGRGRMRRGRSSRARRVRIGFRM